MFSIKAERLYDMERLLKSLILNGFEKVLKAEISQKSNMIVKTRNIIHLILIIRENL